MDVSITLPSLPLEAAKWISDKVEGCKYQRANGQGFVKLVFPQNLGVSQLQKLFRRLVKVLEKTPGVDVNALPKNLPGSRGYMARELGSYFYKDSGINKALMQRLLEDIGAPDPALPDDSSDSDNGSKPSKASKVKAPQTKKSKSPLTAISPEPPNKRLKLDRSDPMKYIQHIEGQQDFEEATVTSREAAVIRRQVELDRKRAELVNEQKKLDDEKAESILMKEDFEGRRKLLQRLKGDLEKCERGSKKGQREKHLICNALEDLAQRSNFLFRRG